MYLGSEPVLLDCTNCLFLQEALEEYVNVVVVMFLSSYVS